MTTRTRLCFALAAIVTSHVLCGSAWGDDAGVPDAKDALLPADEALAPPATAPLQPGTGYLHLRTSSHVITDGGSSLRLAPGYYIDESTWLKLDGAFRTLQDDKTRRDAENKSLRTTTEAWQPGWKTLAMALATGIAGGIYLRGKL